MSFERRLLIGALAMAACATLSLATTGCGSSTNSAGSGSGGAGGHGGAGGLACSTGGTSGTAGGDNDAGMACTTAQYIHTFGFGAIFEGWTITNYSTGSLVPVPASDGSPAQGTIVELDTTDGSPSPPNGSLKLSVPFDGTGQLLLLAELFTTGMNVSGTRITAQIKLDSGLIVGPSDTARANLVLKSTGSYIYAAGPAIVLDPSAGWTTLTIDGDVPSVDSAFTGYTPCDVREIDIEIRTGDTGNYRPAVIHVDSIAVASKTCQ